MPVVSDSSLSGQCQHSAPRFFATQTIRGATSRSGFAKTAEEIRWVALVSNRTGNCLSADADGRLELTVARCDPDDLGQHWSRPMNRAANAVKALSWRKSGQESILRDSLRTGRDGREIDREAEARAGLMAAQANGAGDVIVSRLFPKRWLSGDFMDTSGCDGGFLLWPKPQMLTLLSRNTSEVGVSPGFKVSARGDHATSALDTYR
jgi:hypothetical protein